MNDFKNPKKNNEYKKIIAKFFWQKTGFSFSLHFSICGITKNSQTRKTHLETVRLCHWNGTATATTIIITGKTVELEVKSTGRVRFFFLIAVENKSHFD